MTDRTNARYDDKNTWYNFVSDRYEKRSTPTTDAEAVQLIPQYPAAINLYYLLRNPEYKNESVLDAMVHTLEACVEHSLHRCSPDMVSAKFYEYKEKDV